MNAFHGDLAMDRETSMVAKRFWEESKRTSEYFRQRETAIMDSLATHDIADKFPVDKHSSQIEQTYQARIRSQGERQSAFDVNLTH